jgi:phosphoribosylformimino-5-aminoimidazole carboxamide ribotide isomerase
MQIWPAIDIRAGKCVRLQQGDYDRETVFGEDPAAVARQWVAGGATCLHLVDLDGARDGQVVNAATIASIIDAAGVPCELGGGIRDEASIRSLLDLGLHQLVIGTQAIRAPDWFRQMTRRYPNRMVLGVDARQGQVATDGWLETSETSATDLALTFDKEPIAAIVYTDISKDGMLEGPNLAAMAAMKKAVSCPVIASGGVTSAQDVRHLAAGGLDGCIVGRALYEGRISLEEALAAAKT